MSGTNALFDVGASAPASVPSPPPSSASSLAQHHANLALAQRHTFPPSEIATRLTHSAYTRNALDTLLAKPSVSYSNAVATILKAADDGVTTHAEALKMASRLPADPAGLRQALSHLRDVSVHATELLTKERQRRHHQHTARA